MWTTEDFFAATAVETRPTVIASTNASMLAAVAVALNRTDDLAFLLNVISLSSPRP
jgi:hypothetical protein